MGSTYNALASAIVKEENSTWPNNPGAITDVNGNPIDFGSTSAGFNALLQKLQYDASGASTTYSHTMTLAQFESLYKVGDQNAANNIGSMLGVQTSTQLSNLSDQALGIAPPSASNSVPVIGSTTPITGTAGTAVPSSTSSDTSMIGKFEAWLANSSANIVAVLLGLVLVASAVWGFSTVKDTMIQTAKKGAALVV